MPRLFDNGAAKALVPEGRWQVLGHLVAQVATGAVGFHETWSSGPLVLLITFATVARRARGDRSEN